MTPVQSQGSVRAASGNAVFDCMSADSLNAICAAAGPFVTVYLPARHPGAADLPRTARMKTIVAEAAGELERRRFQGPTGLLLKPLEELAENPAILAGGSDSAVFVSPGFYGHFRLAAPARERVIVASYPHIAPLLADRMPERVFYVLAMSKKLLRLGRWRDGQFTEIPLPGGVPKSFEVGIVFDRPDHDLQNRSAGGSPSAQVGPARFGTGSERDLMHERLHHYFQHVDRELNGFLGGAPLVLVGVAEELAAYRAVSEYRNLLAAGPTSPGHLSWAELRELGREAVLETPREEAKKTLGEFRGMARRDHVTSGVREVLEAAREGRIHKLLFEKDAERQGLLGPSFPMDFAQVEGEQDLINAAAVETIRGHGEVHVVEKGELDAPGGIAAILRYGG